MSHRWPLPLATDGPSALAALAALLARVLGEKAPWIAVAAEPARVLALAPASAATFAELVAAAAQALETADGELPPSLPSCHAALVRQGAEPAPAPLVLHLLGGEEAELHAPGGWLPATALARLAGAYETLLLAGLAHPEQPLAALPTLPALGVHQLAREWNDNALAVPAATLHALVAEQVAATPAAPALLAGGRRLSYRELDERANRLAQLLRRRGVGAEVRVGVCLERTADLLVALLAVLKAGGAYVPLDPAYPRERLELMLADSAALLVLTQEELLPLLPPEVTALVVASLGAELAVAPATAPPEQADPTSLAYLIYTSGSTGRPKGVAIPHASAVAFMAWATTVFPAEELAGVAAVTSVCFDLSVFELFFPLTRGGTVLLAKDALALAELPEREAISLVNTVPSAIRALVEMGAVPPRVRTVNLAGEPLKRALARQVQALPQVARLLNLYGPSEDTTYSTFSTIDPESAAEPTIGRAIANTQAHIVTPQLRPLPAGAVGELVLGGAGLARGYLGRPALTAERFVPDPFGPPGSRLYATGDLARWRADGEIEFLGRRDHQVKLRGFRIELEEIEARLVAHPTVGNAVVVVRDDKLVAYVEPKTSEPKTSEPKTTEPPAAGELSRHLAERLPAYMVPSAIVVLAALPLTPNGKVDRKALPEPPPEAFSAEREFVAPRSETEAALAAIVARVLGLERVGVEDDFLALGGHSLLAAQVLAEAGRRFGSRIPVHRFLAQPTVAGLAQLLAAATPSAASTPRTAGGPRPLSIAQRPIWLSAQLAPESPVYNVPVLLRVHGEVEPEVLARALAALAERHEPLRYGLLEAEGEPSQGPIPGVAPELRRVEVAAAELAGREAEARRALAAIAREPFDLVHGPVLRAAWAPLGPGDGFVLVDVHHLFTDGWSTGVILRDLAALYAAFAAGEPSPLPPLGTTYGDFLAAEAAPAAAAAREQAMAFWQQRFAGELEPLALPLDHPRPPRQRYQGARFVQALPPGLLEDLRRLGQGEGATAFVVLLAAFATLLHRHTGQRHVVVGSPLANREGAGLEELVGLFTLTLPLRFDLGGNPRFRALLAPVREQVLGAFAHSHLDLTRFVRSLPLDFSSSWNPLLGAVLAMQNLPLAPVEAGGRRWEYREEVDTGTAKFDLTLFIEHLPAGPVAVWEYARELFDPATIERLAGHLGNLLAAVGEDPEARLGELALLAPAEREEIVAGWNSTATDYPRTATLHGLFAATAAARPAAVALVEGDAQWSYAYLAAQARLLAARLTAAGVELDERVALPARRSAAMVAATLGILQAGGAYLPIDPALPPERLDILLRVAGARLWVAVAGEPPPVAAADSAGPLTAVAFEPGVEVAPALPPVAVDADHLAYVMFTSGSTGAPKGVAITHGNVVRLVCATDYARFGPDEVFLHLAPPSFDAATFEIWGSLLHGARLEVFGRPVGALAEIADLLAERRVSTLWLTAGLFHQLVDEHADGLAELGQLLAGGDVLATGHVRRLLGAAPGLTLIDGYGPTEGTTFTCCHPVRSAAEVGETVAIGRPIANTRVYLLDGYGQPVPVGVTGALMAGGAGLARGYLGRPGLTAERFVPDPFGPPGSRLYATGDLARYRPDGAIEFLGRADFQVKIRGFRIEPGEIEAALLQHPAVQEALVVPRPDAAGGKRLVAYLVRAADLVGAEPTAAELRSFLGRGLPEYMLPAAFVFLAAFPLNVNGKVDRKALPAPEASVAGTAPAVPPRNVWEEVVADQFARLLGLPAVGAFDSFFALGGHSLAATRLLARLRTLFGLRLGLAELFAAPTVEAVAGRLAAAREAGPAAPERAPAPLAAPGLSLDRSPGARLPLASGQERLWFEEQLHPGVPVYNVPLVLRLAGRLDIAALAAALGDLAARHEALRIRFGEEGGRPFQQIAPPAPVVLATAEAASEAAAWRLAEAEARRPFDLAGGPLARYRLLRWAADGHLLAITLHHAVSDGWSMEVLGRDLAELYAAHHDGRAAVLPPLPRQFLDFALSARGDAVDPAAMAAVQAALGEVPQVLDLPADRPRPPSPSYLGTTVVMPVAGLAATLPAFAERQGLTPFMVLTAACFAFLHRATGQRELLLGTPVAGREEADAEGVVGFFAGTAVLHGRCDGDPSFATLLARAREAVLGRSQLPFEKIVEALKPERDPSRAPLAQAMVSLAERPHLELPGLRVTPRYLSTGTAKVELLFGFETGEAGPGERELGGWLEASADLFEATTAARFAASFVRLLADGVAHPERPLSRLALLAPAERHQLCLGWNDSVAPDAGAAILAGAPAAPSLAGLCAGQAARTPEAVALVGGGEHLSFAALDGRAGRLAGRLAARGVGPEVRVGVCLGRSPRLVEALLAILRAGGAYLPLDPSYPADRLSYMLADAAAPLVLAERELFPPEMAAAGAAVLWLDGGADESADLAALAPAAVDPENLAYVIYTSGSTGRPKGVAIPQRAATAFVAWGCRAFSPAERAGMGFVTSISFDISVFELFVPLAGGGTAVLVDHALALAEAPESARVTFLNTVSSAFAELVRLKRVPPALRAIGLAGEPVPGRLIGQAFASSRTETLYDLYGPTETTVYSTWSAFRGPIRGEPPIGRPLPAETAYVLAPSLELVPVGWLGELYLGGVGVARGYLGRPALTAERFLPDPFGAGGGRLYRTGDRVRRRPDGVIEYLGRLDHQVKLRGFRIELAEIEAALAAQPGVAEAAVLVREDRPGDRRLVAYLLPKGEAPAPHALRSGLAARLPDYMLPAAFVVLADFPRTPNGKLDRKALPPPPEAAPAPPVAVLTDAGSAREQAITAIWRDVLGRQQVGLDENFFDLGGHSLLLAQVLARLQGDHPQLTLLDLLRHSTVRSLARHLAGEDAALEDVGAAGVSALPAAPGLGTEGASDIAIVGIACRFPGSTDAEGFWAQQAAGVEAIRRFTRSGQEGEIPADEVPAGGVLDGIELFDAEAFGLTSREAETTDPQHRLFLECAWEALERAGYPPGGQPQAIGVFAGCSASTYLGHNLEAHPQLLAALGDLATMIATDKDFLPTRVSYKLDLTGPSLNVQTACSTSLVAVHLACQSLVRGECALALAGGATVRVPHEAPYLFVEEGILSPDGHCRTFDAAAAGTVPSNGVGVVVLKPLAAALADGDSIHAVIKGTAINNDGAGKIGYTAPSEVGQREVIRRALASAGVSAASIGYVEAHGTGTALGDPIEVAALTAAYREDGAGPASCALSSAKTSLGHMDAAAGIGGLVRAALAVEHGEVPANLHFERPNPALHLAASPFFVAGRTQPFPAHEGPRRAAVSSFGLGGTNAHAILEEAPPVESGPGRERQLLLLAARSEAALEAASERLAAHLFAHPEVPLADVAFTLHTGRRRFAHRRTLVAATAAEAAGLLRGADPKRLATVVSAASERPVAFLFPGQGAQHVGMAAELYAGEAAFRAAFDACAELAAPSLGADLRALVYPAAGASPEASEQLTQTAFAQPALFAVEHALAELWRAWGIEPAAMIGHSLGEYVAATQAGVMGLADAVALVVARGRLMQALPPGAMLGVSLPAAELAERLGDELSLAAVNAPALCVVSGPTPAIEALAGKLSAEGVHNRRLHTSHAFHSAMVEGALPAFRAEVAKVRLAPPRRPFVSNLTGTWMSAAEATDPETWVRHLRSPVRFADGLATLVAGAEPILLEVGPGRTATAFARRHPEAAKLPSVATLPPAGEAAADLESALAAAGELWLHGAPLAAAPFYAGQRRKRVVLPTYPFERRRYWIAGAGPRAAVTTLAESSPELPVELPVEAEAPALGASHSRPQLPNPYVAPRSEIEKVLAEVWEELLGVAPIGIHDDFFRLGGHSLLATQLVARLRRRFGAEAPLRLAFEAATIADQAAAIAASQPAAAPAAPTASPAGALRTYPLSSPQQRLWLLAQLGGGASAAYNIGVVARLEGPLVPVALTAALQGLVERHEVLRSRLAATAGEAVQEVLPELAVRLPVVDLRALAPPAQQAVAAELAERASGLALALAEAPLWRAALLRLGAAVHHLLVTFHHTVFDGWSFRLFFDELGERYAAHRRGEAPALPPLAWQYGDFARAQRAWLESPAFAADLDYWRGALAGLPALLELPADRARPPLPSFRGARRRLGLGADVAERLRAAARAAGATPFMVLYAAFTALLARLSGQTDFAVGTPVANREREEIAGTIGFFVNTLALRTDAGGDPSFAGLLDRVRSAVGGAFAHPEVPFERLVEELKVPRQLSANPLFQVMLVYQGGLWGRQPFADLELSLLETAGGAAHFDLTLSLEEDAGGLAGLADFSTDLFDASTVGRWLGSFGTLLAAALAAPETALSRLPLLAAGERQQLLREWNDSGRARAGALTLHGLVAAQVARTPQAPAVLVAGGGSLSYAELAARADEVAQLLAGLGLRPGELVGLATDRSLAAMVGLLGILQAGGAYLPLDATAPAERLEFQLGECAVRVALMAGEAPAGLAGWAGQVVDLLALPAAPRATPAPADPDGLAYVIYTSGSTGRPNGVLVPHRAAVNLTLGFVVHHGFGPGQRVLVIPPLTFDASVGDVFPCLATGAALVFHPNPAELSAHRLSELAAELEINGIDTAASLWRQWVEEWTARGASGVLPGLELMMMGGEAVGRDTLARWVELTGGTAALFNHYGPTEATVCATSYRTQSGAELAGNALPIGRPLANVRAYLLDEAAEPAPIGVPAELFLGGAGITWGYLDRPAKTAAAFVPDPFGAEPGARLYRTRDRARLLAGGLLQFLGRRDHQVKIRGYRIEPGEIELALAEHPAVRECLVTVAEGAAGKRLVAYAGVGEGAGVGASELRHFLAEKLPAYMVPADFVLLAALPLTANGKIDRRALPVPAAAAEAPITPPRTTVEAEMAALWARLLELPAVDVFADFFSLGGSSLVAMRLMAEVARTFGVELPLTQLFTAPTVADLAAAVEAARGGKATAASLDLEALAQLAPEIRPDPAAPPLSWPPRQVFFTGATGFLGPFVLRELAARVTGPLHVLVRAASAEEGARRLREALAQYGLWSDELAGRLLPVLGQLGPPRLGIDPETWQRLASEVDLVVHNAAEVNFLHPYARLAPANVGGTEEILRLAAEGRRKAVCFTSSLGVFLTRRYARQVVPEGAAQEDPGGLDRGYEQTKWVAERLVVAARERGIPASTFRPARITGAAATGAANPKDIFSSLLAGLVQLGLAPDVQDPIDMLPVDYLARAIVTLALDPAELGHDFHFYNRRTLPFADLGRALAAFGYAVELVPYKRFRAALAAVVERGEANALAPFLPLFPEEEEEDEQPIFAQARSQAALARAGLSCPPADQALVHTYLSYLVRTGFLPAPATVTRESGG